MPRYSDTVAISSARRRRWPLRRSVTAEGERPSALARPLRVLPVRLRPTRIQSTVKGENPPSSQAMTWGADPARWRPGRAADSWERAPFSEINLVSEKPQFKKTKNLDLKF